MCYISEGIPSKVLTNRSLLPNVEIHQKSKWFLLGIYKPPIQNNSEFARYIITTLNNNIPSYETVLLRADLNMIAENLHLNSLIQLFNLNALIKTPTCF